MMVCLDANIVIYGTEQKISSSFEQEDGATRGRLCTRGGRGACSGAARRAAKFAESGRTRSLAWPSVARTGRPGARTRRAGHAGQDHHRFIRCELSRAATGSPGRQGSVPRKELLADPGPEPGANASSQTNEPAAWKAQHDDRACSRVGWTSRPFTPDAAHSASNARAGR
jgi:hypothetical protein